MANAHLMRFLAHSVELESEAHERYLELADVMTGHHNQPVADFFSRMATEADLHLAEVSKLAAGMALPQLKAWEFDWPEAEPPETASYEALHYRMSLRQAITLALGHERAAEQFYRKAAESSSDSETTRIASDFADEENSHAAELERMFAAALENGAHRREGDDAPHMPE